MSKRKKRAQETAAKTRRGSSFIVGGVGLGALFAAVLCSSRTDSSRGQEKKPVPVFVYSQDRSTYVHSYDSVLRDSLAREGVELTRVLSATDANWFSPVDSFSEDVSRHVRNVNAFYDFLGRPGIKAPDLQFVVLKNSEGLMLDYSCGPLTVYVAGAMGVRTFVNYEGKRGGENVAGIILFERAHLGQAQRQFTVSFTNGRYVFNLSPKNIMYSPCEGMDDVMTIPLECLHWSSSLMTYRHLSSRLVSDFNGRTPGQAELESRLSELSARYRMREEGFVHGLGLAWMERDGANFGVSCEAVREKLEFLRALPEYRHVPYFFERARNHGVDSVIEEYARCAGNFRE